MAVPSLRDAIAATFSEFDDELGDAIHVVTRAARTARPDLSDEAWDARMSALYAPLAALIFPIVADRVIEAASQPA